MGLFKPSLVLGLVLLLQTCGSWSETDRSDFVVSLYPPYSEAETIIEEGLLGTWVQTDAQTGAPTGEPWIISNPTGRTVAFCVPEDDAFAFVAFGRMTRVGGSLLVAFRPGFKGWTFETGFSIPGYALAQIELGENRFRARTLERTKLTAFLATGPNQPLAMEDTGERLVITSRKAEYRDFLSQLESPDSVFGEWGDWTQRADGDHGSCPAPGTSAAPLPPPPGEGAR